MEPSTISSSEFKSSMSTLPRSLASGTVAAYRTTDEYLWLYVSPVILLLGLCGNLLILLVINRRNLRGTTTYVYLTALAIFDTLALVSGIVPEWTHAGGFFQFNAVSSFTCQLEKFVFYTTSDTAIWILVFFTLDRFVAVCFPFYKRSVCVPKRSRVACVLIFALAFVKNLHVFWTRALVPSSGAHVKLTISSTIRSDLDYAYTEKSEIPLKWSCSKKPEFTNFESMVRPWIAFATVSVLPFVILVVCNSMIIWTLARVSRSEMKTSESPNRREKSNTTTTTTNVNDKNEKKIVASSDGASGGDSKSSAVKSRRPKRHGETKSYRQTTMMCLSASITFLVCVFPSIVMLIGKPHWSQNEDGSNNGVYDVFKAVNNQLAYLNHSVNFFLYCMTGRKFRQELLLMLSKWLALCGCFPPVCAACRNFYSRLVGKRQVYDPSSFSGPSTSGNGKERATSVFVTSNSLLEYAASGESIL